jgi:hypothetical protein
MIDKETSNRNIDVLVKFDPSISKTPSNPHGLLNTSIIFQKGFSEWLW